MEPSSPIEASASRLDNYLDINDLSSSEKMERALAFKDRGTTKFKDGLFKDAHRDYQQAFKYAVGAAAVPEMGGAVVSDVTEKTEDLVEPDKIDDLKCALYLNIAACLQVGSYLLNVEFFSILQNTLTESKVSLSLDCPSIHHPLST